MHAPYVVLRFEVLLNALHRIFDEELSVLGFRKVERVVAGHVPFDLLGLARVNEDALAVGHQRVVAKIGADDNIATLDEAAYRGRVV